MQKSQDLFLKTRGYPRIPGIVRIPRINPYPGKDYADMYRLALIS
jgi:hypothetical protein